MRARIMAISNITESLICQALDDSSSDTLAVVAAADFAAAVRTFVIYPGDAVDHYQRVGRVAHRVSPLLLAPLDGCAPLDPIP